MVIRVVLPLLNITAPVEKQIVEFKKIQGKCNRHIPYRVVDNALGIYGMSHVSINIIQQIHDEAQVQFIKL